MASKNDEKWMANYEALKAHVLEAGHFPNKHDKRLNWAKVPNEEDKGRNDGF